MDDLKQPKLPSEQVDPSTAPTQALPRVLSAAETDEADFQAGQKRVLKMIAANAPLTRFLPVLCF
jgi:hypothetical protein